MRTRWQKIVSTAVGCVMVLTVAACMESASNSQDKLTVHKCSGSVRGWFPADRDVLKKTVETDIADADPFETDKPVVGIIAPHAGYKWAGGVAGWAYRAVSGRTYRRVIVLAPSHTMSFRGVSVGMYTAFETPLGSVPVDLDACRTLLDRPGGLFKSIPAAHTTEHSLENQLPFLQVALGDFSLVPLVISYLNDDDYGAVAAALRPLVDSSTLVVASSDFTHYGRDFGYTPFPLDEKTGKNLESLARRAARPIVDVAPDGFISYLAETHDTICGRVPITVLLDMLKGRAKGHLLKYDNSGTLTGEFAHAVSYVSIVFTSTGESPKPQPEKKVKTEPGDLNEKKVKAEPGDLNPDEQAMLLKLARRSLESHFGLASRPDPPSAEFPLTAGVKQPLGVFVTLKKHGILRGCIGHIQEGSTPLYKLVMEYVIQSAIHDPRFPAMTKDEVGDVHIEISVMRHVDSPTSPFKKCDDVNNIVIGRDGIMLTLGRYRGIFLPQVPVEQHWNLDQYLNGICRKAGVPKGSWKLPNARLDTFSAQVFGE